MRVKRLVLVGGLVAGVGNIVFFAVVVVGMFGRDMAFGQNPRIQAKVRAQCFVLVDAQGQKRASLSIGKDGTSPLLALFDARGKVRAYLGVESDGTPSLGLNNADGNNSMCLDVLADGSPFLGLYGARGVPPGSAVLGMLAADGGPFLALWGAHMSAVFDPAPGPHPGLTLYDAQVNERVGLSADTDGGTVSLWDAQGSTRAVLGAAVLEATRTEAEEHRAESSLVLFDRDGKMIWEAP